MTPDQISDTAVTSVTAAAKSTTHGTVVPLVFGIILLAVSLIQLINPRLMWRLRSKTLRHPEMSEPSDAGFLLIRISAAVVFCFSVLLIIIAFNAN